MKDSSDSSEMELPLSVPVKVSHQALPPLPPRFKNVYGTKGAKKRWLATQRALLEGASRLPDSEGASRLPDSDDEFLSLHVPASCAFHWTASAVECADRVEQRKHQTKFVENQESTVLQQLHDQQADAEMAEKKEADKAQQQSDRMKKRRATDAALGDATELRRDATARKQARADAFYTPEELSAMSAPGTPLHPAISKERVHEIVKNAQELMNSKAKVCAVCDEFVLYQRDINEFAPDSLPSSFFNVLRPPDGAMVAVPELKPFLRKQYDVSHLFPDDPRFSDLLLSPRAFSTSKNTDCSDSKREIELPLSVPVCKKCMLSLRTKRKVAKPPKFSIANGFFIGQLPLELRAASRVDLKVCATAYLGGYLAPTGQRVCIGGPGYVKFFDRCSQFRLRGHCYATKQNVSTVAATLPIHPDALPIKVLLAGPFSQAQLKNTMADEEFHQPIVRGLLEFFREQNIKYQHFDLRDETLDANQNLAAIPGKAVHPANFKHERPSGPLPEQLTTAGPAIHIKNKDCDIDATLATIKVDQKSSEETDSSLFVVQPSTEFMDLSKKEWLASAFPGLFPFG